MLKRNILYSFFCTSGQRDLKQAVKWCEKAAEQGHVKAQYALASAQHDLGVFYFTEKNFQLAAELFEKAANQGNANAQNLLGTLLYSGEGVKKDLAEAEKWLKKAAKQGHVGAKEKLADLKKKGYEVPENQKKLPKQGENKNTFLYPSSQNSQLIEVSTKPVKKERSFSPEL